MIPHHKSEFFLPVGRQTLLSPLKSPVTRFTFCGLFFLFMVYRQGLLASSFFNGNCDSGRTPVSFDFRFSLRPGRSTLRGLTGHRSYEPDPVVPTNTLGRKPKSLRDLVVCKGPPNFRLSAFLERRKGKHSRVNELLSGSSVTKETQDECPRPEQNKKKNNTSLPGPTLSLQGTLTTPNTKRTFRNPSSGH